MVRLAVLWAAVAPGLLVLAYGVIKTRGSWSNEALWTAFFLGGLGIVAVIPVEFAIQWLVGLAALAPSVKAGVLAIFEAGIPEEAVKYLILVGAAERHVDAWRRQDIIVLALAVSLGFATVENFFAVLAPAHWQIVAALRAVSAVPGHGVDGLAMGALLTASRVMPARRTMWAVLAFVIPAMMHAAYDFPLSASKSAGEAAAGPLLKVFWPTILLISSIVSIWLCNWILPAAQRADRLSGRDLRTNAPTSLAIMAGCAFLVIAPALAAFIFLNGGTRSAVTAISFVIFPSALAIDLIWTGIRRTDAYQITDDRRRTTERN
jgi:RsiW-degrading membrane proteinase PrsW (M82 family)